MRAKHIIVIYSCQKNRSTLQKAIQQTWAEDIPPEVPYFIVEGGHGGESRIEGRRIFLNCPDNYESLSIKTREMLKICLREIEFDFLTKCDDDNYLHVKRFLSTDFTGQQYVGYPFNGNFPMATGGLYTLSKTTIERLLSYSKNNPHGGLYGDETREDKALGLALRELGIRFTEDQRFNCKKYPTPYESTGKLVSTSCSAKEIYAYHAQRSRPLAVNQIFAAARSCWGFIKRLPRAPRRVARSLKKLVAH